jgi:hypothetical protein
VLRTVFAIALAGLIFAAVFGTDPDALAAPRRTGVTADYVTVVLWQRCYCTRTGRLRCRACYLWGDQLRCQHGWWTPYWCEN